MKFFVVVLVAFAVVLHATSAAKLTYEEWKKIQQDCVKILRTSPETEKRIQRMQFNEDDSEAQCFMRCTSILSGSYDDETGLNVEASLEEVEGRPGFDGFKRELEQCVAGVTPAQYGEDYCKKAFVYFKCELNAFTKHLQRGQKLASV